MAEEVLTIRQLAELLQLSERTVYRLANDGEIPGLKVGGSWRFPRSQVAEWMEKQVQKSTRPESTGLKARAKGRPPKEPEGG